MFLAHPNNELMATVAQAPFMRSSKTLSALWTITVLDVFVCVNSIRAGGNRMVFFLGSPSNSGSPQFGYSGRGREKGIEQQFKGN